MAENKNRFLIDGTLYAKTTRPWGPNAKGMSGEFFYYAVEVATPVNWTVEGKERSTVRKDLIKFMVPRGFDMDSFEIADPITIRFNLKGHEYAKKDGGKDYGLEANAEYIAFTDVNRQGAKRDAVFTPPTPGLDIAPFLTEDDLPF